MGKKSFPKRPSGGFRSSTKKFYTLAGIEPERIGGKVVRNPEEEEEKENRRNEELFNETVLYTAPVLEIPVKKLEIQPPTRESFMRGLWNFVRGERV